MKWTQNLVYVAWNRQIEFAHRLSTPFQFRPIYVKFIRYSSASTFTSSWSYELPASCLSGHLKSSPSAVSVRSPHKTWIAWASPQSRTPRESIQSRFASRFALLWRPSRHSRGRLDETRIPTSWYTSSFNSQLARRSVFNSWPRLLADRLKPSPRLEESFRRDAQAIFPIIARSLVLHF